MNILSLFLVMVIIYSLGRLLGRLAQILIIVVGNRSFIVLQPHQRGIFYRKGVAIKEVGPGKHHVRLGFEKVMIVDIRPTTVSYHDQVVVGSANSALLYGFFGTAKIADVGKAMRSARNYPQVPEAVLLRCARSVLGEADTSAVLQREAIESRIRQKAEQRLRQAGFNLTEFRLNQLQSMSAHTPNPV